MDDVLQEANLNGKTLAQAMVDNGFLDENSFYQTIADSLGTEYRAARAAKSRRKCCG